MPDYDLGTARGTIELDASSLGRASQAFATLGAGMVGFGAVAVGAFAYSVKSAADFERQISAVGAVSNATADQMDQLRLRALELGGSTVYSADEIARAMEQLAKAGITIPEIMGGATEATVALAAAAGDELAGGVDSAAEVIANAMRTFGASADDMGHYADVIVGAAATSTTSVDDMAISMRYAGPIASQLGLSIDDLSTMLAILGDRGIRGSTAGTTLRGVLLSLGGASGPARETLRELGIITADGTNRFYDMHGALKPMPEVMQILADATAGLSEQERVAAYNAIFQRRAMNGAMILAEEGEAGFHRYAAAIAAIDAENVAARKLDNLSGDMTILRNSVDALVIQVGMQFQDMLRGWVQGLTGVVDWLRNLDPELLGMIMQVVAVAGAISAALGAISLFISFGVRMYRTVRDLIVAGRAIIGVIRLLSVTLLTSPWFWVIAAIVALGVALYQLYQNNETFRNAVQSLFAWLEANVLPIIQDIIAGFQAFWSALMGQGGDASGIVGFFQTIGEAARELGIWLIENLPGAIEAIGNFFTNVLAPAAMTVVDALRFLITEGLERVVSAFEWVRDNVWPVFWAIGELVVAVVERIIGIIQTLNPIWQAVWDAILIVLDVVIAAFTLFIETIINIWNLFGDNLLAAATMVWDFIRGIVEAALNVIRGVIQVVTGLISGDWSKVWEGIKNIFSGVWDGIKTILSGALDFIELTIQTAVDAVNVIWDTAWNTVKTVLSTAWDVVKDTVRLGIDFVKNLIDTTLGLIGDIWDTGWTGIRDFVTDIISGIVRFISEKIGEIIDFFAGLPGSILGVLSSLGSQLDSVFRGAMIAGWEAIQDVWQIIRNFFEGIGDRITGFIGDLGDLLYDIGRDIIQGLINGIQSMFSTLGDVVGGIGGMITSLKGPPEYDKVMLTPQGQWIMQGLIRGIESQMGALKAVMKSVAPAIQAQVNAGGTLAVEGGSGSAPLTMIGEFNQTVNGVLPGDVERETAAALRTMATEWEFAS